MLYVERTWNRDGTRNRMQLPIAVRNLEKSLIEVDEMKVGSRHPDAIERALRRGFTLHSPHASFTIISLPSER